MKKCIAVIDMRAFYSYVECIDRGLDPYTTPLVVADKERGKNTIVLSVTPFLKNHGVPSRLRINELPSEFNYIYATPRMALYMERSADVMSTLLDFVSEEDLHIYSVDEAFLNLGPYLSYYKKSPKEIILMIKEAIKTKLGLETTAGIGDNMFQAKIALDVYAKKEKDGVAIVTTEEVQEKLWPITPLRKVWGIGSRLEARLNALGMYSLGDIAQASPEYLHRFFCSLGEELHRRANGIDESDIREVYVPVDNSLTQGQTLFRDYSLEEIPLILRETADELTFRMRRQHVKGKTVHLFIGYSKDLGSFGAQMKMIRPSNTTDEVMECCMELLKKHCKNLPIRGVSIALSGLIDDSYDQLSLFENYEEHEKDKSIQLAIDNISERYGRNAVLRCSALLENSTIMERHTQIGGHRR